MNFLSRANRLELAGLALLTAAFAPLVVQAEDLGLGQIVPTLRKAVERKTLEVQLAEVQFEEEAPAEALPADVPRFAPRARVRATLAAEEKKSEEKADEAETEVAPTPAAPVDPLVIRFHLMDGSMISGKLTIDQINVATEFGELTVPILALSSFKPGLQSYPKISSEIDTLIENLGSDDYQTREQAHKDLAKRGLKVRRQLQAKKNDENAERKRHVDLLLKELEVLAEEQLELEEEGEEVVAEWVQEDTVVTSKFTVLGTISPQSFVIESKYGPLNIKLSDVRLMDKEQSGREPILRKVAVPGTNLAQMSYKETGIRIEAGDKVTISADGQLTMSPWGNNTTSGPDGGQNFGWYVQNKIPGGALIGKIGNSGEEFKIGSKHSFVSKRSGVLRLAIAMQGQYAQQGYNFPGQYNVRVKVEGK